MGFFLLSPLRLFSYGSPVAVEVSDPAMRPATAKRARRTQSGIVLTPVSPLAPFPDRPLAPLPDMARVRFENCWHARESCGDAAGSRAAARESTTTKLNELPACEVTSKLQLADCAKRGNFSVCRVQTWSFSERRRDVTIAGFRNSSFESRLGMSQVHSNGPRLSVSCEIKSAETLTVLLRSSFVTSVG